ncbi:hypothetical protein [Mycobacterium sp. pW045]|uniref:hypothetical protein n=1 Tax=Mycobacterium sp. pW045 TaxID=3238984 RepID=UPI00351B4571
MNRTTPAKARFENVSDPGATLPGMNTTTDINNPNVPIPAGATSVSDWDGGGRMIYGATSETVEASGSLREDVEIATGGYQEDDGTFVGWEVWAGPIHPDNPMTAAQARQIGEALITAADELDAIAGAVTR